MSPRGKQTVKPENPPRLWLFTLQAPGFPPQRFTFEDAEDADGVRTHNFSRSTPLGHTSAVQLYVREDVAALATEAAVKNALEEERARTRETCHVDE